MLFNSRNFALFFPIVFILYWYIGKRNLSFQNILLLAASYFFYGWWDWRFLFLLGFSTGLDYYTGLKIFNSENPVIRKTWLIISVTVNLSFLGIFKYYDFFARSFAETLLQFGWHVDPWTLSLVLPVGISFYTFHGLSYVIDIYNRRTEAERSFVTYGLFVAFFPLLVAGPIERATHLLPQLKAPRAFQLEKATDGLRQVLWGLAKKIVIADQCAVYVNEIFANYQSLTGSTLVLGAVLFAVQIYGDFSGYSDIALGCARMLGIELLKNFSYPYFSRDIAEFWRRWHISLTTWFRDYVYIPLGGNRGSLWIRTRNVFIIFLLSGFWHGANWTFIVWGLVNAIYFIPLMLIGANRNNIEIIAKGRLLPSVREAFGIAITFGLTIFAWIFFRSPDIGSAFNYVGRIFSSSLFAAPNLPAMANKVFLAVLGLVGLFFLIEWRGREYAYAIAFIDRRPMFLRWAYYYALTMLIILVAFKEQPQFIYFQF